MPPQSQVIVEFWFYPVQSLILVLSSAAAEVSSILESRIAGTSLGGDVQETGRVLSEHTRPTANYYHSSNVFSSFSSDW